MTPKWKTKPYTVTGWIGIVLILLVAVVDIILACWDKYPTLSQYVQNRWEDQPLFGWIVIGVLVWLIFHWFIEKKLKK